MIKSDIDFDSFREKISEDDIILACETLPFMSFKRIVLVYDFPALKTGKQSADKLNDYIEDISLNSILIFYMIDKADKRKKIYKSIKKIGMEGEFGDLADSELISWIVHEFGQNGKKAANNNARELLNVCGNNMMTLKAEIAKISSYSEKPEIEKEDILKAASKSLEYNVFKVHDFLLKKDIKHAFALLKEIIESEKNPFGIMGLIASKFRLLYKGRAMLDAGYPSDKAIKLMGGHPYAAKIALLECKKFSAAELRADISKLAELDFWLKSGKADMSLAFEKVLMEIYKV